MQIKKWLGLAANQIQNNSIKEISLKMGNGN